MNCDCEHIIHEGSDHYDQVRATNQVKLIYGTYHLCQDCTDNCYNPADMESQPVPIAR